MQAVLVLGLVLACSPQRGFWPRQHPDGLPHQDTGGDTAADTAADSGHDTSGPKDDTAVETGDPPDPDPWADDAYWTDPGPYAVMRDASTAPSKPHYEAWLTTSPDGLTWEEPAVFFAHSFSSLDLLVWDDRVLILLGSAAYDADLGIDAPFKHLFAFHTLDLQTWGSHMWEVPNAERELLTDASLYETASGVVRAVYYSTSADYGDIPPHEIPGDHEIKVADRDGESFVEHDEPVYAAEYLLDPSMCEWEGVSHLFATGDQVVVHATSTGWEHETDEDFHWDTQVPFCYEQEGQLKVVTQPGGGWGDPELCVLGDDGVWGEAQPFFSDFDPFDGNCTSPVLGEFLGRWVMVCATWDGGG